MALTGESIQLASRKFWNVHGTNKSKQGKYTVQRKGFAGFVELIVGELKSAGMPLEWIQFSDQQIPGYFRPGKSWDMSICDGNSLIAVLEFTSQLSPSLVSSYNLKVESILGGGYDFWKSYLNKMEVTSRRQRPWLGNCLLIEDSVEANKILRPAKSKLPIDPIFHNSSYLERFQTLCNRLIEDRLYDAISLISTARPETKQSEYKSNNHLEFSILVASLLGRVTSYLHLKNDQ